MAGGQREKQPVGYLARLARIIRLLNEENNGPALGCGAEPHSSSDRNFVSLTNSLLYFLTLSLFSLMYGIMHHFSGKCTTNDRKMHH